MIIKKKPKSQHVFSFIYANIILQAFYGYFHHH